MLKLRTFGSVFVARADGAPMEGAAGHRRILALLSVLAVAGEGGLSRDKLVGLLWPEVGAERARHSLTQALYSARRALGADDLFVLGGDVRLNRDWLTSDVQELEVALDEGDLERAASLYQGPFLDGFFLPGSQEFESWSSLQRTRFEDRISGVLDRLAERAEAAGDLRGAVEWRKQLAAIRPLDASTAVGLMNALARAGDRAGAIQHARLHELLLREQLGLGPDSVVTALADRLREPVVWQSSAPLRVATDAPLATAPELPAPSPAPVPFADEVDEAAPRTRAAPPSESRRERPLELPRTSRVSDPTATDAPLAGELVRIVRVGAVPHSDRSWFSRRVPVMLIALVLIAALAVQAVRVGRGRRRATPVATVQLRQKVVVAPFRVAGASASLSYMREGMVELLSTRLADDSAARSVDAGAVLSAWRAAGLAGNMDVSRGTVLKLAARLGAERVVIGNVVGSQSHAVVNAEVLSVSSGGVVGQATVEGPADSVTALVDRLAARLLVQEAGEESSLAEQTTSSLPALRAFLTGQAAFHRSNYAAALRAYERALRLDSTFALAALQLARTADRLPTADDRDQALALAWRLQDALSERDRALLVALAGPRYPAPGTAVERLVAWERFVDLTPDRADSRYEQGAGLFHVGMTFGLPNARARAASALRHALALDSGYAPARALLTHLAAGMPREPAAGAIPRDIAIRDSTGPLAPFLRWRVAVARSDSAALRRMRDTMHLLGRANLRALAQASQFDVVALADGRRALRILRDRPARLVERVDVAEAEHSLALNQGRLRDAMDATNRLHDLLPDAHAHLRLRVLDAMYGDGSRRAAEMAARELARSATASGAAQLPVRAVQAADACVHAQWRLSQRDTTDVRRAIAMLRSQSVPVAAPIVAAASTLVCAELLETTLAVVERRRDAPAMLQRLDSLAITPATSGDASSYAPILIARLHSTLGDAPAALRAIRKRVYMVGWPRYLATALKDEGRYAALAGATDVARLAYDQFLTLRAEPDSALSAEVEAIRQAAASLPARSAP